MGGHPLQQPGVALVVVHVHGQAHHPAPVAAAEQLRARVLAGVAVPPGVPPHVLPAELPEDGAHLVGVGQRVVRGHVDQLARPRLQPPDQRGDDADGGQHSGNVAGLAARGGDRHRPGPAGLVAVAGHRHHPAQRELHQVAGGEPGPRPVRPERGDPGEHQPRVRLPEVVPVQPGRRQHPGAEAVDDHVGRTHQPPRGRPVVRFRQVQHDRALGQVVVPEVQARVRAWLITGERGHAPGGRAGRRLDLDHVGPHVGQQLAAVLGLPVVEFEDPDAAQRPAPGRLPGPAHHEPPSRDISRGRSGGQKTPSSSSRARRSGSTFSTSPST